MQDTGFYPLQVTAIVPETIEAASIVLEVPAGLRNAFRYLAGQFLTLQLAISGKRVLRCYSLSSAPEEAGPLKITVKRVQSGLASNWLLDSLQPGATVMARRPAGVFVLSSDPRPILMFAGGSGITPMLSLIKSALSQGRGRIRLLYASRAPDVEIFRDELTVLARRWPDRLEIEHHYDASVGLLSPGDFACFIGNDIGADCYVCGPAAFMAMAEHALSAAGVPRSRLNIERFVSLTEPSVTLASGMVEPDDCLTIECNDRRYKVPYERGQSILAAALACQVPVQWSCGQGHCGACIAQVTNGQALMSNNDVLSDAEVRAGMVLICQARPVGPRCGLRILG